MAKFSYKQKPIERNPKDLVRYHLKKRYTNKTYLYFMLVVAVFAFGVVNLILNTKTSSQASELNSEQAILSSGVKAEEQVPAVHGVFPPTKQEVLLQEMMAQEGYVMSEAEKVYFER